MPTRGAVHKGVSLSHLLGACVTERSWRGGVLAPETGEVSKALIWGTKFKGYPKPSNHDIILMQYVLKIKTNVKQTNKQKPHNEQSVTILHNDRIPPCTCSARPYFPHLYQSC